MAGNQSEASGRRGRVVMLVDNGVNGDSRVQKVARSAADAGWSVTLLGRSSDGPGGWRLGEAEVRLVPMPDPLARTPALRRAVLRLLLPRRRVAGPAAPGAPAAPRRGAKAVLLALARRAYRPWDRLRTWFWLRVEGDEAWRRLTPELLDFEAAYGPAIDALEPDIIHAHDFRMLGVGARAKSRAASAGRRVRLVWDAHEFLPGMRPWRDNARWLPAMRAHERAYAGHADAVVTVSEELARLLRAEHGLTESPAVVRNAPALPSGPALPAEVPDLRAACGVDAGTPLIVYSGVALPQRGLTVMVEALPRLPGVHVALVVNEGGLTYVRATLLPKAARLGVADRVHVAPYVPHEQVVRYLSAADAGVVPVQRYLNYEIALVTKFFEYSFARLPVVVSDVRTMADTVRSTGQGEVFRAGDVADYARAVRDVLADPARYRAAYDQPGLLDGWTWDAQAKVVEEMYTRLTADQAAGERPARAPDVTVVVPVYNTMPYLTRCLRSLLAQSIGADRMEIIAVDDGSTDGSQRELDRFARRHPDLLRVVHQRNSGGPAAPCNRGLALATGRYVYFVGADDYLGPEALARLVAAADRYGSDVVLGRVVGVNNRYIHPEVFARTEPAADLFDPDSGLRWSLSNIKLFRRELVERHGLRFGEDMPVASDQPFTIEALYRANRITVLADYDYYYAVRRLNSRNITYSSRHLERLRAATRVMDFVASLVEPGKRRDTVLLRHFSWELSKLLGDDLLLLDRETQERHLTDDIRDQLDIEARMRLLAARHGTLDDLVAVIRQDAQHGVPPVVVDGDRRYAGYPQAGDAAADGGRDGARPGWQDITVVSADWIAKLDVVAAEVTSSARTPVIALTLRSPQPDLAALVCAPLRITAAHLDADAVSVRPDGDGTLARAEFRVDSLVAASAPLGRRWNLRARVSAFHATGSATLRGPHLAASARTIRRHGRRLLVVKVVKDRSGHILIAVTPVTRRRVIAGLRHAFRRD
jgi:glycosyltransferase involved in cell wall biosynthesis